jgi:hypothetical protein
VSYKVRIARPVAATIASWDLPDHLLVEVYLRLRDDLSRHPADSLIRLHDLVDRLMYSFSIRDLSNRTFDYIFVFQVVYGQDEESIVILDAHYERTEVE